MDETVIPWSRVTAFMRRHMHDVRNGLNSLDLEMEFLSELVPDGEASDSVGRMRKQLRAVAQQLRTLAAQFQDPSPVLVKIPAAVLLKIWREKHAALTPAPEIRWVNELKEEEVNVDVEMLATAFRELLTNAALHGSAGPLTISAQIRSGDVLFELREPKQSEMDVRLWGEPFYSTRRDRYGLGLWTVRRLMESSAVLFKQRYVPADSCLVTELRLPML